MDTTVWDAKGHTHGVWVTTKNPTCTEAGKKTQSCQTCGVMVAEDDIPATGHFFGDWGVVGGQRVRVCQCGAQEFEESGCSSLLSIGTVAIMLLSAGAVTLLSSKKRR